MSDEPSGSTKQLFHGIVMLAVVCCRLLRGNDEGAAAHCEFARDVADQGIAKWCDSPYAVHDTPPPE